jgi:hypothetical protein
MVPPVARIFMFGSLSADNAIWVKSTTIKASPDFRQFCLRMLVPPSRSLAAQNGCVSFIRLSFQL